MKNHLMSGAIFCAVIVLSAGVSSAASGPPCSALTADFQMIAPCYWGQSALITDRSRGEIIGWEWWYGDEPKESTAPASREPDPKPHVYAQPGTYTIRLVVTDRCGAIAKSEQAVEVLPQPVNPEWVNEGSSVEVDLDVGLTRRGIIRYKPSWTVFWQSVPLPSLTARDITYEVQRRSGGQSVWKTVARGVLDSSWVDTKAIAPDQAVFYRVRAVSGGKIASKWTYSDGIYAARPQAVGIGAAVLQDQDSAGYPGVANGPNLHAVLFNVSKGITGVCISEDPSFANIIPIRLPASGGPVPFSIGSRSGLHTVYLKGVTQSGLETPVLAASVTIDDEPPVISAFVLTDLSSGDPETTDELRVMVTCLASGLPDQMRVRQGSNQPWSRLTDFQSRFFFQFTAKKAGQLKLQIELLDRAGNPAQAEAMIDYAPSQPGQVIQAPDAIKPVRFDGPQDWTGSCAEQRNVSAHRQGIPFRFIDALRSAAAAFYRWAFGLTPTAVEGSPSAVVIPCCANGQTVVPENCTCSGYIASPCQSPGQFYYSNQRLYCIYGAVQNDCTIPSTQIVWELDNSSTTSGAPLWSSQGQNIALPLLDKDDYILSLQPNVTYDLDCNAKTWETVPLKIEQWNAVRNCQLTYNSSLLKLISTVNIEDMRQGEGIRWQWQIVKDPLPAPVETFFEATQDYPSLLLDKACPFSVIPGQKIAVTVHFRGRNQVDYIESCSITIFLPM